MDNTSLCKLIREALDSPEKAEVLLIESEHLPIVLDNITFTESFVI